ncbi:MAG: DNA topoisomerase IB [Acidimicrobiia bacterium]
MTIMDSMEMAADAGLHYVSDDIPGLRRVRRGKGFSYVRPDGRAINGAVRKRIGVLAIPPAWEQVWISPDFAGHILATGYDSAGRKQYIYHPAWEQMRDEVKFERMGDFGKRLVGLRRELGADLRTPGLSRRKVTALSVAVLDRTLIRVGNRRYAEENEAYGLTTLTSDHVAVDGIEVQLEFAGKGGGDHQMVFQDRRLASLITRCQELAGQTLFSYEGEEGTTAITSTDVNKYLSEIMAGPFTAKDFRTWGASTSVVESLATDPEAGLDRDATLLRAIDVAAEKLGNTREVCRSSYVHPIVGDTFRDGRLEEAWRRSRRGAWLDRAESAVNRLIAELPT